MQLDKEVERRRVEWPLAFRPVGPTELSNKCFLHITNVAACRHLTTGGVMFTFATAASAASRHTVDSTDSKTATVVSVSCFTRAV